MENNFYNENNPYKAPEPQETPHEDFFRQESYYEKNPLPRNMNNPYEEPKFAEFVPQELETTGAKKRYSGAVAVTFMSVVIVGLFVFLFAFLYNTDSFASVYDEPEETISELEDETGGDTTEAEPTVPDEDDETPQLQQPDPEAVSDNHEIESASKPSSPNLHINADGTYTSEGVYEVVVPSVVSIRATLNKEGTTISAGSGIILSNDGYIVTNEHVISGAFTMKATTFDGDEYDLVLVGKDTRSDLAVLKMDTDRKDFKAAVIGNSDELVIGERVYAIGNSGGIFSNTFTGGYVSGLNRTLKLTQSSIEMNYIQTDATINPGNSGGPLVNEYAQIIGINNFKYFGKNAECENMTFAISINEAVPIINDIIKTGYVTGRPRIGITYTAVSPDVAKRKGLVAGLYIAEVAPECDISNCDLIPGDVITKINGKEVYSSATVLDSIKNNRPGDKATAEVYRKDEEGNASYHTITFRLEELKE